MYGRWIDESLEHPRARHLSRVWAAISTTAFGLTALGFMTISIDGPTILLAIFFPFVGLAAGTVAVVVAYRRDEPRLWPWGSVVLNLVPAGFWVMAIVVIESTGG